MRVLAIDPSGTGTTGIYLRNELLGGEEFHQITNTDWKEHYSEINKLIKQYQPNILLFEDTNYIHKRTRDGLSLFRLLGALECLEVEKVSSVNVLKVKEMTKKLLKGIYQIENLEYLLGRGKGWMFKGKRISIHQLESYLVYYLFQKY